MTALRTISALLLTIDLAGFAGLTVTFVSSISDRSPGHDAPIWITLAVLVGVAALVGWLFRRGNRPGWACLPLLLAAPFAVYGLMIGLMVILPGSFR